MISAINSNFQRWLQDKWEVKLYSEVQMCVEATAHRTLGNAFYVSLFRAVVDVVLFFVTSGEHSDSGHCPPFFGGGNIPRQGLMYCLRKVRDFRYQSIMYVTTPSIHPPLL